MRKKKDKPQTLPLMAAIIYNFNCMESFSFQVNKESYLRTGNPIPPETPGGPGGPAGPTKPRLPRRPLSPFSPRSP